MKIGDIIDCTDVQDLMANRELLLTAGIITERVGIELKLKVKFICQGKVTVTNLIEIAKEQMCDKYCKYPGIISAGDYPKDFLYESEDNPCISCPLNNL